MDSEKITTRQLILNIASDLFMDKGFQATSTRMIADLAGITQPNLYYHFKTKEAIYIAVLEDLSAEVKQKMEEIVSEHNQSLEHKLTEIVNFLRERHPVNLFIMQHDIENEMSKENHLLLYQLWRQSYLQPLIELFSNYVGDESPFNSFELALHFYGTISPYIQKDKRFHESLRTEQLVHLFVYGILDRDET
ncbi:MULTISPECIES: TetR/AcrR family transcriptional regulator [unclassified Jeotgalibaca]|uniref:TetR/AcrR family transcriptional regulator n=1 Tax=unclassified Jeotgalibaca TaxID=2621505 RepID=UPI003FD4F980